MAKLIGSTLIALLLTSCSMLTDIGAKMAGSAMGIAEDDGLSVELDAQIGDRQNDVETQIGNGVKGTGDVTATKGGKVNVLTKAAESNFEKAESVAITNNKQAPLWMILLLILGWVLPDPMRMWQSIRKPKGADNGKK